MVDWKLAETEIRLICLEAVIRFLEVSTCLLPNECPCFELSIVVKETSNVTIYEYILGQVHKNKF